MLELNAKDKYPHRHNGPEAPKSRLFSSRSAAAEADVPPRHVRDPDVQLTLGVTARQPCQRQASLMCERCQSHGHFRSLYAAERCSEALFSLSREKGSCKCRHAPDSGSLHRLGSALARPLPSVVVSFPAEAGPGAAPAALSKKCFGSFLAAGFR